jgi:hypothetical protein
MSFIKTSEIICQDLKSRKQMAVGFSNRLVLDGIYTDIRQIEYGFLWHNDWITIFSV